MKEEAILHKGLANNSAKTWYAVYICITIEEGAN
jgi:hypothetical protein